MSSACSKEQLEAIANAGRVALEMESANKNVVALRSSVEDAKAKLVREEKSYAQVLESWRSHIKQTKAHIEATEAKLVGAEIDFTRAIENISVASLVVRSSFLPVGKTE